jgi:UDP-N-acetylglucosamine 2-epimerase (non-hydrolysing)/GDP/UDP-N,N'-diacetylbacillosamine 2-epimerase (hydrolysing)
MLKLDPAKPYVLIVQHPVTTEVGDSGWQISQTLKAVKALSLQGVILYPNNDAGSRQITKEIKNANISFFRSLPPEIYINVLRHSAALIGNSSSGIHETATLHIPTVNIGTRQQGRERPGNVIDVGNDARDIMRGLKKALYDKQFRKKVTRVKNVYGDGCSAERIVRILKNLDLKSVPIQKKFFNRFK